MSGNVREWCWDVFPGTSNDRYDRGGSYDYRNYYCAVDHRDRRPANSQLSYVGFRIVCSAFN